MLCSSAALPVSVPGAARFGRLARSAFRAGGLVAVLARPSVRSFSGAVLVGWFSSFAGASRWAALWSRRLGRSVCLAAVPGVGWSVSVPAGLVSSRLPVCSGQLVWLSGGVRGVRSALLSSGLWVS